MTSCIFNAWRKEGRNLIFGRTAMAMAPTGPALITGSTSHSFGQLPRQMAHGNTCGHGDMHGCLVLGPIETKREREHLVYGSLLSIFQVPPSRHPPSTPSRQSIFCCYGGIVFQVPPSRHQPSTPSRHQPSTPSRQSIFCCYGGLVSRQYESRFDWPAQFSHFIRQCFIGQTSFEFRSGVLNFEVEFWISKSSFEFRNRVLNFEEQLLISKCSFEFRSAVLKFSKSTFEFRSGVLNFEIEFWISKSSFEFRSGVLNFEVEFWISKSSVEIRNRVLNFEIEFWISKWSFEFRSGVLNFEYRMSLLGFRSILYFYSNPGYHCSIAGHPGSYFVIFIWNISRWWYAYTEVILTGYFCSEVSNSEIVRWKSLISGNGIKQYMVESPTGNHSHYQNYCSLLSLTHSSHILKHLRLKCFEFLWAGKRGKIKLSTAVAKSRMVIQQILEHLLDQASNTGRGGQ
jgi:hypothetical protein